jgi:hypothetical protein
MVVGSLPARWDEESAFPDFGCWVCVTNPHCCLAQYELFVNRDIVLSPAPNANHPTLFVVSCECKWDYRFIVLQLPSRTTWFFWCTFQSFMTMFHHKLRTREGSEGFGERDELVHYLSQYLFTCSRRLSSKTVTICPPSPPNFTK